MHRAGRVKIAFLNSFYLSFMFYISNYLHGLHCKSNYWLLHEMLPWEIKCKYNTWYVHAYFNSVLYLPLDIIPIFERRLSFRMLYCVINDHTIILQWRWGSRGTVSFATGPWRSSSGVQEETLLKTFYLFYVWRVINSLK